jgi:hypothetical protein
VLLGAVGANVEAENVSTIRITAIQRDPKTRFLRARPYSRLRRHVRRVHPVVAADIYSS